MYNVSFYFCVCGSYSYSLRVWAVLFRGQNFQVTDKVVGGSRNIGVRACAPQIYRELVQRSKYLEHIGKRSRQTNDQDHRIQSADSMVCYHRVLGCLHTWALCHTFTSDWVPMPPPYQLSLYTRIQILGGLYEGIRHVLYPLMKTRHPEKSWQAQQYGIEFCEKCWPNERDAMGRFRQWSTDHMPRSNRIPTPTARRMWLHSAERRCRWCIRFGSNSCQRKNISQEHEVLTMQDHSCRWLAETACQLIASLNSMGDHLHSTQSAIDYHWFDISSSSA